MNKIEVEHVTKSDANIFSELGFEQTEAEQLEAISRAEITQALELKAQLMTELATWMAESHLKQAEAAKILMVSRPRVSDVVNKKAHKFTLDALVQMLNRTGKKVTLSII